MLRRAFLAAVAVLVVAASLVTGPRADAAGDSYLVGAATRAIHPDAPGSPLAPGTEVKTGGFGFGDGSVVPSEVIGPGRSAKVEGEEIRARAIVVDDGDAAIAFVTVETQGMFAAYQDGLPGLRDIAAAASARTNGALPADNIVISNNHTHSGPDLIGVWGFVPHDYARFVAKQTVDAIVRAYFARRPSTLVAGADWAPDIIYNQTCTEALNQSPDSTFPNDVCDPFAENKDAWVRVLQARDASTGEVVATMVAYAAHATLGGASGLHGDWPQFLGDELAETYGGVGLAFQGAVGRTQPCRPRCGFTDTSRPGYDLADRKDAYTTFLLHHVRRALLGAPEVGGPVAASRDLIRHEVSNPVLLALVHQGGAVGAPIKRSLDAPWTVGNTIGTTVSSVRVGDQLVLGAPGEAYPNIPEAVADATNLPTNRVWTLSLADDQLGYLIAPVEAYPAIASQIAVNDNSLFNISPTFGDHVACSQTRLASDIGFDTVRIQPRCVAWDAVDAAPGE